MEENLKQLLLKDLCTRLPYGVICSAPKGNGHLCSINQTIFGNEYGVNIEATKRDYFNDNECNIRPYLRPMSSMTEKECAELRWLNDQCDAMPTFEYIPIENYRIYDWLNRHHFDFRNLIERGLAIAVTEENNPYKD